MAKTTSVQVKSTQITYYNEATIRCACGNVIKTGSTKEAIHTDVCSQCHPFYTGSQKYIDTAGRVDRFQAKMKKVAALKKAKNKTNDI